MEEEALLKKSHEKGGLKAVAFIIGTDALDKMASQGLMANMILYLTEQYHMEMASASNVLFFWSSACSFTPVIGAIVADSYLGRCRTIGFGSLIYLLGLIILWSTSIIPQARPPSCTLSNGTCQSPSIFQSMFLCASLGFIAIGAGGIRSSALAFGADQLENGVFKRSPSAKEGYFNCYYALSTFSVIISLTLIVYIQEKLGWGVGFAVPCVLMLFGVISFYLASPSYVKFKSETNLVTGLFQVVVAAYRNRNLRLSDIDDTLLYHCKSGSHLVTPTRKLRFLNKACIVTDHEKDLSRDGKATNPWSLCSVDQVERLKALIKVIPIWSTGMIMSVNISQNSFPVLQAASMDRRIIAGLTIPAASFGTFTIVFIITWICLYDRVFLPLASKAMRRPLRLSSKTRMGIGIFLSTLAVTATAIVERIRRGQAGVAMSAMWLLPQHCLSGFSEGSNMIGQIEFYFSELPRSMSSIASTLSGVGMSLASLLASLILNIVDNVSRAGGHESWISSDIDKGRYDYYYLLLAGLSVANIVYFVMCSNTYGPLKEESELGEDEDDNL